MAKGVIAAGHEVTAQAGKDTLAAGGNAVDAAIAAAFAACVAEPVLTGLGAGGFMLVHDAKGGRQTLLDFFIAMPGKGLEQTKRRPAKLVPTPVDFGETTQMFHSGHASVGVPGFVAGLCEAHRRFGSLPLADLVAPAKAVAKQGVKQNAEQEYLIKILSGILGLSADSKKLFTKNGRPLKEGERFYHPDLPAALDEVATRGAASFYRGELAAALVKEMEKGQGYITAEDLAEYEVAVRNPVSLDYRGATLLTNPPPSSGGALIAHTLHMLAGFDFKKMDWHSDEHVIHLTESLFATNQVRQDRFDQSIHDEDVLEQLLSEQALAGDTADINNRLGNTTHLSVIDGDGNAVAMTSSNGANSGIAVPGTGILLNSILGEDDLNPQGFHQHPVGRRLTSMMSPTLVLSGGQPALALGSAGSNRIRSAIVQVISGVLDFGFEVKKAVEEPRVHVEGKRVELEGGITKSVAERLAALGYQPNLWPERNLFFGGVQAARLDPTTGQLSGAGDPRRGGVAMLV